MTDSFRDPELDRLVRELNQNADDTSAAESGEPSPPLLASPGNLREDDALARLLATAVAAEASDAILLPGSPPVLRIAGRLRSLDAPPLAEEDIASLLDPHLGRTELQEMRRTGAVDLGLRLATHRFRLNVHRQRGTLAAAVRVLPRGVPTLAALELPPGLAELVRPTRGLVLVCGPTGAGKTSTLAALVGELNRTRTSHVITIEEPIEYEHEHGHSIIEQIEVGADAPSFAAALRAALRQDPDVLLVGEMRDLETIGLALTAAETGHLVLSTLHANDAMQAVHRIVDVFPAAQQAQVRQQLALSLNAIVSQQLIPRADRPGRVPAIELLLATAAVRAHIRKERVANLYNEITLGRRLGMVTLEASLARLVRSGAINREEAEIRASHPDELDSLLRS